MSLEGERLTDLVAEAVRSVPGAEWAANNDPEFARDLHVFQNFLVMAAATMPAEVPREVPLEVVEGWVVVMVRHLHDDRVRAKELRERADQYLDGRVLD